MSITGSHPPLGTNNLETTYLQGQSLQWQAAVGVALGAPLGSALCSVVTPVWGATSPCRSLLRDKTVRSKCWPGSGCFLPYACIFV